MHPLMRVLRTCLAALFCPLAAAGVVSALAISDLGWLLFGRRLRPRDSRPRTDAASVVIPTWQGRELLEKNLPPLIGALSGNRKNEIIVVDNGSTDGSAEFVRSLAERTPSLSVRLLAFDRNLGFGGGSNAGVKAARNDIVVLLNNDMRVESGFLQPLLDGFTDEKVFSVSCQIFLADPRRRREETGLTQGWWENGCLRVRHRIDSGVTDLFPCFYGGGGSCAYDRRKFLELGGFDPLLAPFYLEDTDLGYLAWKRGWKALYQPRSVVHHEHRGTIGKRFTSGEIARVLAKNFLLFCWKNIHDWRMLSSHICFTWAGALVSAAAGDSPERASLEAVWLACRQLPQAVISRRRARKLAEIGDTEAFRRPLGGYYRDRFASVAPVPGRLQVLFVSPYAICPPVHGGGVFMHQTLTELTRLCDVHLIAMLDTQEERAAHEELAAACASAEFPVRSASAARSWGSLEPHAVREFKDPDVEWLIHRTIATRGVDVVQLEYTPMAQYAGSYRRIANVLFEHDVYFQSIARGLSRPDGALKKAAALLEYLRALRFEVRTLPMMDRVQVCSRENGDYLRSFLPELAGRLQHGLRAGIDTSRYTFRGSGRDPDTMLFLGSFRHMPNMEALAWFTTQVFPIVLESRPKARLIVIGSDPPPPHALPFARNIDLLGFVPDIREPLARYSVFLCPVRSGSGVRVKLLEAFAAGIPAVSTRIGAEGLASTDGHICALADEPRAFAEKVVRLLDDPVESARMAARARAEVEQNWDMRTITRKLAASYREAVEEKRAATSSGARGPA